MVQANRGDRQHRESAVIDRKWIFVGAVGAAAIFHHPYTSGGDVVGNAMVEEHDAIGDVFLEPEAGQGFLASFAGDEDGHAERFEKLEQAADFTAQQTLIGKAGEQRLHRIEDDASRADRFDRVAQAHEQSLEVVLTGFGNLMWVDLDMIDGEELLVA